MEKVISRELARSVLFNFQHDQVKLVDALFDKIEAMEQEMSALRAEYAALKLEQGIQNLEHDK